ncbi:hypothetical protein SDJN02_19409, partial [Cucurbita argyrosperma subsp. argyrosperma]
VLVNSLSVSKLGTTLPPEGIPEENLIFPSLSTTISHPRIASFVAISFVWVLPDSCYGPQGQSNGFLAQACSSYLCVSVRFE